MKLACVIDRYFPFGGLQRDFLSLIQAVIARGHVVHVFVMSWQGETVPGMTLHQVKVKHWTNHGRTVQFAKKVKQQLRAQSIDLVIGFKPMPGLDIYFMGEPCFAEKCKARPWLKGLSRYRGYCGLEKAVYGAASKTHILYIDEKSRKEAQAIYQTPAHRFYFVPPGIERSPLSATQHKQLRLQYRDTLQITAQHFVLLFIASNYALKGLEKLMRALSVLSKEKKQKICLLVVGDDYAKPFEVMARELQLTNQIRFLGARSDIDGLIACADILVHPAKRETGGKVLLEALINHLPVLTSCFCGYAQYVRDAQAGEIVSDLKVETIAQKLDRMLSVKRLSVYQSNAQHYMQTQDFTQFAESFVSHIERLSSMSTMKKNRIQNLQELQVAPSTFNHFMALTGKTYRAIKNRKTLYVQHQGAPYFIKKHWPMPWREWLKNIFQCRWPVVGAWPECLAIIACQKIGVLVPRIFAYGIQRGWLSRQVSFVMLEAVTYDLTLEALVVDHMKHPLSIVMKRKLIRQVAEMTRKLHEAGINHRDYYLCHFLYHKQTHQLTLIDLHRAQIRKSVPMKWLVKDLGGLLYSATDVGLTRSDLAYFMMHYHGKALRQVYQDHIVLWQTVFMRVHSLKKKKGKYPRC